MFALPSEGAEFGGVVCKAREGTDIIVLFVTTRLIIPFFVLQFPVGAVTPILILSFGGSAEFQGLATRVSPTSPLSAAAPAPTEKLDVHDNPEADFPKSFVAIGRRQGHSILERSAVGAEVDDGSAPAKLKGRAPFQFGRIHARTAHENGVENGVALLTGNVKARQLEQLAALGGLVRFLL